MLSAPRRETILRQSQTPLTVSPRRPKSAPTRYHRAFSSSKRGAVHLATRPAGNFPARPKLTGFPTACRELLDVNLKTSIVIRTVSDRISVGRKGGLSVETRPSRYARNVAGNRRWCADIRSRFLYEQLVEAEGSANQDQRDENESGPTPGLDDRTQRGLADRSWAAGHLSGAHGIG